MAVLHVTYKHNPQASRAVYDGFYQVITSYRWARLSDSIWAITADDPPKAVWQKLKRYIDPDDRLVMLTFKSSSWKPKDQRVLAWLLDGHKGSLLKRSWFSTNFDVAVSSWQKMFGSLVAGLLVITSVLLI